MAKASCTNWVCILNHICFVGLTSQRSSHSFVNGIYLLYMLRFASIELRVCFQTIQRQSSQNLLWVSLIYPQLFKIVWLRTSTHANVNQICLLCLASQSSFLTLLVWEMCSRRKKNLPYLVSEWMFLMWEIGTWALLLYC